MKRKFSAMCTPKEAGTTFLHQISVPALQNGLRHLSSKPAMSNWVAFVHHDDALMVMHPSNPLRDVAQYKFARLCTSPSNSWDILAAIHLPDDGNMAMLAMVAIRREVAP